MNKHIIYTIVICFLFISCKTEIINTSNDTNAKIENKKPNILFIAVDDLRPELNFYGSNNIKSPNLDLLSKESLIFNRSYCNIPVCGASRASIMTGARPTRKRFIGAHIKKDDDFPEAISLPMLFKQNGYTTVSNGKIYHNKNDDKKAWHDIWQPSRRWRYAYEENYELRKETGRGLPFEIADVPDSTYMDGKLALKVIKDLRKLKTSNKPFFLTMGVAKPHLPFNAPKKYWDMYDESQIKLPESYSQPSTTPKQAFHNYGELRQYEDIPKKGHLPDPLAKKLIHGYYACVSYMDAQVGLVLDELKRLDLDKDTIVILWGDHGWNLGDHKLWCKHVTFQTSLRTPLLLKVPGKTNGKKTDAIVEHIDIYPTLVELAGITNMPKTVEGESFAPLLEGRKLKKDWAVSKYKDAVTLIKNDLFYTEWVNENGKSYARMLFNHKEDPLELNNLAENLEYKTIVSKLSKELKSKWGKDFFKK